MPSLKDKDASEFATSDLTQVVSQREGVQLKVSELDSERFNLWAALGFSYSITNPPLAIASYLAFVVGIGGSPYFFWCLILVAIFQIIAATSLAELAAIYPHTAGQMYWTSVLAPRQCRRFLTYFNGAVTCLGWVLVVSGSFLLVSNWILAFVTVVAEDYAIKTWHSYLVSVAIAIFSIVFNTVLVKSWPGVTKFMIFFLNSAVVFIFVTLLVKANPKASARTVFIDVVNESGWESDGLVFFLGLLPAMSSIALFDTAAHMAEEVPQPERQIPQIMVGSMALGGIGCVAMVLALLFCNTNAESVLAPLGNQPILQICWDAWNSKAYIGFVAWIYIICFCNGANACVLTGSRIVWSLAESGGLPFAGWLSKVNPQLKVPVNAVIMFTILSTAIAALSLGAQTVLNGIYGASGVCFAISYSMPLILLLPQRHKLPKKRYFNLGRFGIFIDVATLAWEVIILIFPCFPLYLPVTVGTMNWAAVCAAIGISCILLNWLLVRSTFKMPQPLYVEALDSRRAEI